MNLPTLQKNGKLAIDFLKCHLLPPTPDNYSIAYAYVTQTNSKIVSAIKEYESEGLRVTERAFAEIKGQETGVEKINRIVEYVNGVIMRGKSGSADMTNMIAHSIQSVISDGEYDPLAMLEEMGRHVAAYHNALEESGKEIDELRRQLEDTTNLASRDALTKLNNRRAIDARLQALHSTKKPFGVAMIDIDHFKSINDTFNHCVGDRVLVKMANLLTEAFEDDFVGRYGGEEFMVIFSEHEMQKAVERLDAFRRSLERQTWQVRNTDKTINAVTVSIGYARNTSNDHEIVEKADKRLYIAKNTGRNKVIAKG